MPGSHFPAVRERSGSHPYIRPLPSSTMTRTSTCKNKDSQEPVGSPFPPLSFSDRLL
jgi:hypothetical protein